MLKKIETPHLSVPINVEIVPDSERNRTNRNPSYLTWIMTVTFVLTIGFGLLALYLFSSRFLFGGARNKKEEKVNGNADELIKDTVVAPTTAVQVYHLEDAPTTIVASQLSSIGYLVAQCGSNLLIDSLGGAGNLRWAAMVNMVSKSLSGTNVLDEVAMLRIGRNPYTYYPLFGYPLFGACFPAMDGSQLIVGGTVDGVAVLPGKTLGFVDIANCTGVSNSVCTQIVPISGELFSDVLPITLGGVNYLTLTSDCYAYFLPVDKLLGHGNIALNKLPDGSLTAVRVVGQKNHACMLLDTDGNWQQGFAAVTEDDIGQFPQICGVTAQAFVGAYKNTIFMDEAPSGTSVCLNYKSSSYYSGSWTTVGFACFAGKNGTIFATAGNMYRGRGVVLISPELRIDGDYNLDPVASVITLRMESSSSHLVDALQFTADGKLVIPDIYATLSGPVYRERAGMVCVQSLEGFSYGKTYTACKDGIGYNYIGSDTNGYAGTAVTMDTRKIYITQPGVKTYVGGTGNVVYAPLLWVNQTSSSSQASSVVGQSSVVDSYSSGDSKISVSSQSSQIASSVPKSSDVVISFSSVSTPNSTGSSRLTSSQQDSSVVSSIAVASSDSNARSSEASNVASSLPQSESDESSSLFVSSSSVINHLSSQQISSIIQSSSLSPGDKKWLMLVLELGLLFFIVTLSVGGCLTVYGCIRRSGQSKTAYAVLSTETKVQEEQPDTSKLNEKDVKKGDSLDTGGYATVFKGTWCGKTIAIKEVAYISEDAQQEANIMLALRNPYIVFVYGTYVDAQQHFNICMEFAKRGSLDRHIHELKTLFTQEQIYKILAGVAAGMAYLHENDIIHRDLKPKNILLFHGMCPKLVDFGMSKFMRKSISAANQKVTKEKKSSMYGDMTMDRGTLEYMAPEVMLIKYADVKCSGILKVSYEAKVDIYSYGILMWELFSGQKPFENVQITSIFNFQKEVIDGLRPLILAEWLVFVKDMILHCWSGDPSERPTSQEIVRHLHDNKSLFFHDAASPAVSAETAALALPSAVLHPGLVEIPMCGNDSGLFYVVAMAINSSETSDSAVTQITVHELRTQIAEYCRCNAILINAGENGFPSSLEEYLRVMCDSSSVYGGIGQQELQIAAEVLNRPIIVVTRNEDEGTVRYNRWCSASVDHMQRQLTGQPLFILKEVNSVHERYFALKVRDGYVPEEIRKALLEVSNSLSRNSKGGLFGDSSHASNVGIELEQQPIPVRKYSQ